MRTRQAAVCLLAIAASLGSTLSFAQPHTDERRDARQERRDDRRDDRRDVRREARHEPQVRYYYDARGPEFRRGGRLPYELRGPHYVVRDWRAYRLAAPPRGYEWVQVGPDFVLVAAGTGVIANVVVVR